MQKIISDYYKDLKEIESLNHEIEAAQSYLDEVISINVYRLNKDNVSLIDKFLQAW